MRALLTLARITFLQQFRNRLYWVIVLFGLLLVGASLLFGALAADQEIRVITDLGLAAAELFALAVALFGAVSLVLEEIESKTIYLLLTRPFPRWLYVAGRFLGLVLAVWTSLVLMELLHVALLLAKGAKLDAEFLVAIPMIGIKIMVVAALALLCSLTFTSAPTAVIFAAFFWCLGHFTEEILFLAGKSGSAATLAAKGFVWLLPNLTLLNLKDHFDVPGVPLADVGGAVAYGLLYAAACLILGSAIFSRKEF